MPILDLDRITTRIARQTNGCWRWTGGTNGTGYGNTSWAGRHGYTHRIVYELLVAPIPNGLVIDHLCRNTLCCNPEHLEPVTHRENALRSPLIGAKTHCKHGHAFDEENTYITPAGARMCRRCCADRAAARRHACR